MHFSAIQAMAYIVAFIFSCWFVLSILNQFSRFAINNKIRKWDHFSLLPRWTFFAPNPGVVDFHLLVRWIDSEARALPWHEVWPPLKLPWWAVLWNPGKRHRKSFVDCVQLLIRDSREQKDPKFSQLNIGYLSILNTVTTLPGVLHPFCQFAILQTKNIEEPASLVVLSEVHRR